MNAAEKGGLQTGTEAGQGIESRVKREKGARAHLLLLSLVSPKMCSLHFLPLSSAPFSPFHSLPSLSFPVASTVSGRLP